MSRLHIIASCLVACSSPPHETPDLDAPTDTQPDASPSIDRLDVRALGVQGFVLAHGGDAVMTAPLFTRQSAFEVGLDLPLQADTAAIDAGLAAVPLGELRAIISGHAHYDHLLDVPHILASAPTAAAYTNLSGRNMLAALAPDRPAGCTTSPSPVIARARVVALDDTLASMVDYTNCPDLRPAGAPLAGSWVQVPGSRVRLMAFCSMHPDQIGPIHFGEGSVDTEQCELPRAASGWLEGLTIAYLIDFLDAHDQPAFRVFYQDAPTNAPIGQIPEAFISERAVDLALLCVGSNDSVENEPTAIIENLRPRFVFSGHWEDFFQASSAPPQPIPLLDLDRYVERAEAALPGPADRPLVIDGAPADTRHVLIQPGSQLSVLARP